jgi:MFS family permease
MIVGAFIAGHQISRYGERKLIVAGFALEASGLFLMTQVSGVAPFIITTVVYGLGTGCLTPAFESLISKVVPEKNHGLAFGFFGTSLGILSLPFPWIGAKLWDTIAPQAPFAVVVVSCIISMIIAWFKFATPKDIA